MRPHKAHKAINYSRPSRGAICRTGNITCLARDWEDVSCKRCLAMRPPRKAMPLMFWDVGS